MSVRNKNEKQTMNINEFIVMYRTAMNTRNPIKNPRNHRQQQRNGRLSHRVAANLPLLCEEEKRQKRMRKRAATEAVNNDEKIAMLSQSLITEDKRNAKAKNDNSHNDQLNQTRVCSDISVTSKDIVSFNQCRETASMPRQDRKQSK